MENEALSTYAKGDEFEEQVFQFLTGEVQKGRFLFRPEYCRVFRKKGYYSRDREDFIVFDISLEVFLPGLEKPSILVLIECKNYSGTVPVGEIEEFGFKISQVSGVNVKGIFASASAFQSGTFNIARNKGFGLLRYFNQAEFRWDLPRTLLTGARSANSRKRAEIEYALTEPRFQPAVYSVYSVTPYGYADGWEGLWKGLNLEAAFTESDLGVILQPAVVAKVRVTYVSKNSIENLAERVLRSISYIRGFVDLSKLVANESIHGLVVSFHEDSPSALGSINFSPLQIRIFATDKRSYLARFTLAHELGHYFLDHGRFMRRECIRLDDIDHSQSIAIPKSEVERLEWQANTFASCLLMPREEFLVVLGALLKQNGIKDRGHGRLYLDGQRENLINFRLITTAMSRYFEVSVTAIRLRMRALEVLVEAEIPSPRVCYPKHLSIAARPSW
ncbi:ImmA/IrrE family metallo-endopeptidase [Pseudomonas sp. LA21]|uniref:ImmA/IrrE family metallo-endopeptidase n=1 Tax=Pseudomonas sp. LA21 TaxID=2893373 RepID=UPI001FB58EC9|nr:ImmA/IrrE family metallo-endopeptidase [Pseudomonas sp. LA21]MCJ1887499.1 ImmA/IrrE family metallo-endopeptidase [Pseudomonas sp. LA21]